MSETTCDCQVNYKEWLIDLAVTRQDPYIVIKIGEEYIKTSRWEINPDNGYVTAQLKDGSILPTRFGRWAPWGLALDILGVLPEDIKKDEVGA